MRYLVRYNLNFDVTVSDDGIDTDADEGQVRYQLFTKARKSVEGCIADLETIEVIPITLDAAD